MSIRTFALRRARGFTLIELMIAVAIIGILVKVAYPAYMQSVRKAHRADAKTALLDLAQREERYMSTTNQYTQTASLLGYNTGTTITTAAPMNVVVGSTAYYTLAVTALPATAPTTFSATATPVGNQASDAQCLAYTLDNTGKQTISGSGNVGDCW